MESNNVQNHVVDEDRFSKLPDDILVYILEKADIRTVIRASFLSIRCRHLPSLLPRISINISDFMSAPINQSVLDEAMATIIKAAGICLAATGRETNMKTLNLRLCLTSKYLYTIGKLVSEAISNGTVNSVELALPTEKVSVDCNMADMMQHTENLHAFFYAYPSLIRSLTKLLLHNARFDTRAVHRLLHSSEQLRHLILIHCDIGDQSILMIDAPDSKISHLRLRSCRFEKVEFICLPKLAELYMESWNSLDAPFSLGFVPCLEQLHLVCPADRDQTGLSLSKLLHGTKEIKSLTLDFQGEKIWMLPEGKDQLRPCFYKLNKMLIHGVFIKFGLLWTTTLLEAAPSLKTFGIKVWDHVCDEDTEAYRDVFSKRTNPWKKPNRLNSSKHLQLTRLEFGGFMAIKKHVGFIRSMMAYAPNLETIILDDKDSREPCDAANKNLACSSTDSRFPKNKYEQDMILNQLRVELSSSVQIIFK
ncbi:hypothetical protein EJB05_07650 [Eragrostis curvula]|uniref:At1g61320/AtMIF1 LRR domain-containing protein n=1 Tax=Eragrostis curvula TaxID=38414 RepID=A0A5J9WIB8_9POAL|nr:hypothetical protein EJB05_07650 [Eragrostis curvula]